MRIARVFPRRTRATPIDSLAFVGGPGLFPPEVDEVRVSVTFEWDLREGERLAREWCDVAPTRIGGPATGITGGAFNPGMYLKNGYTITSRGCPNRCWFCSVWKRDGEVRELPIQKGWNVLDDNLLACSPGHISRVFAMLTDQSRRPEFTGGLEATRFEEWHASAMKSMLTKQLFFAYDTPDDWKPLRRAADLCWRVGFTKASHAVRCYVLCGWPKDTMEAAQSRLEAVLSLGVMPMAMLWRGNDGKRDPAWITFQRRWARPEIIWSSGAKRRRRAGRGKC